MIQIQLTEEMFQKKDQLIRTINFASQDIVSIESEESRLEISITKGSSEVLITNKINKVINDFLANEPEEVIVFQQKTDPDYENLLSENNLIQHYGDRIISLKKEAVALFRYFDRKFNQFAKDLQGVEPQYPTLLPIDILIRTGYLQSSPQYQMFVCHPKEDIEEIMKLNKIIEEGKASKSFNEPQLVLSPAACFHCYMDYENLELSHPTTITFNQRYFAMKGVIIGKILGG